MQIIAIKESFLEAAHIPCSPTPDRLLIVQC